MGYNNDGFKSTLISAGLIESVIDDFFLDESLEISITLQGNIIPVLTKERDGWKKEKNIFLQRKYK